MDDPGRAKVLLAYAEGKSQTEIQRMLGVSRPTLYKCIDKALATGVASGLRDRFHRPHAPRISEAAKVFVMDLACRKPVALGLAAELWTLSALARYVAAQATAAGFPRLARAGKTTVWRILGAHDLKPIPLKVSAAEPVSWREEETAGERDLASSDGEIRATVQGRLHE